MSSIGLCSATPSTILSKIFGSNPKIRSFHMEWTTRNSLRIRAILTNSSNSPSSLPASTSQSFLRCREEPKVLAPTSSV